MSGERIRECYDLRLRGESASSLLDSIKPSSSLGLPEGNVLPSDGLQNQEVSGVAHRRPSRSIHEVSVTQS